MALRPPSLDCNSNALVIAYEKDGEIYVKTSSDYGATWSSESQATSTSGAALNPSVAIDNLGSIVIAFEATIDKAFSTIYKVHKLYNESTWSDHLIVNSNAEYEETYPHIAVGSNFKNSQANILYAKSKADSYEIRVQTATVDEGAFITDDILSLRVSRDKEFKTGVFGAGDFSITLNNTERTYSNEWSGSPYYGRLKSGIELTVELGVREYSGSGEVTDDANWDYEYFPSIVGVASKFELDSANETLVISGRDRAEKLMSYRNFTSELYENKQALELVTAIATANDTSDPSRPSIQISLDAEQQTLSTWDELLNDEIGITTGDAGNNALTLSVINTINYEAAGLGTLFHTAWIERGEIDYLWMITAIPIGSLHDLRLSKWIGYDSPGNAQLVNSWALNSLLAPPPGGIAVKASPYDSTNDCVWLMVNSYLGGGDNQKVYHFDFKNRVFTEKITLYTRLSGSHSFDPGYIVYDETNSKVVFSSFWDWTTGSGEGRYGTLNASGLSLSLDGVDLISAATGAVPMKQIFPLHAVKYGDYYYIIAGAVVEVTTGVFESYSGLFAVPLEEINDRLDGTWDASTMDSFSNEFICYQDYLVADFFNRKTQPILGMDFDDSWLYMFTSPTADVAWDIPFTSGSIEVRRLASRKRTVARGNIVSTEHTTANGYEENDTEYIWFATETLVKEYTPSSSEVTLSGDSDITGGFPDLPTSQYHINLESGEVMLDSFYDENTIFRISYDYKYEVPYAWFEDTSIWDAIQEVASAGDFVCYVDESGQLVFKDRFKYYTPILSDYEDHLTSSGWNGSSAFEITNNVGSPITNIIPGLDYVISYNVKSDSGKPTFYRRRSYRTNGVSHIGTDGDYDINYDTGEIAWNSSGNIPEGSRVFIYFYNNDYVFNFTYDGNITDLKYVWGSEMVINRVTVKGERYLPSFSPVSVREVYAVNPGDSVVNTGFASIKQLEIERLKDDGSFTQKQFDEYANAWKLQSGTPIVDFEFRNKLIGDTPKARESGRALRVKITPCAYPGSWSETATSPDEIPASAWVGNGYKINWDYEGDTGIIPNMGTETHVEINSVEIKANGLRINLNHLEKTDNQYYIQVEIIGYPLTRVNRFTALQEDLASIQAYYTRSYELSNRFISDMKTAQLKARQLTRHFAEERPEVEITVIGCPIIELGDVVTVKDISSGLSGDYFEVTGIDDQVIRDNYSTSLRLRKICEVIETNTGIENPIAGYGGGYINKTPMPISLFINDL